MCSLERWNSVEVINQPTKPVPVTMLFASKKTRMAPNSTLCSTNNKLCDCFAQNAHDCSLGQCKASNIPLSGFSLVDRPTELFANFVLIYKFKRHSRWIFWLLIVLEFNLAIQASRSRGSWVNLSRYLNHDLWKSFKTVWIEDGTLKPLKSTQFPSST